MHCGVGPGRSSDTKLRRVHDHGSGMLLRSRRELGRWRFGERRACMFCGEREECLGQRESDRCRVLSRDSCHD